MRARRAAVIGVMLCVAAGCASILGINDGKPYPPDGDTDGTVGDGMATDAAKEVEVPPDVNIEANIATCDDFMRGLVDGGVFMSPTGSGTVCSQMQPCGTWSSAIQLAQMRGTPIYLEPGNYTKAKNGDLFLPINGTLVVEGGWLIDGGAWTPICDYSVAHVHGAQTVGSTGETAVLALDNASLTLRLLTVEADPASYGTSYGVFGSNTKAVTLEAVEVLANVGQPGTDGVGTGMPTQPNCNPGNKSQGNNGGLGMANGYGLNAFGYVRLSGGTGQQGQPGGGGDPGTDGATTMCPNCMGSMSIDGSTCTPTTLPLTGSPGQPGCGGYGGAGGNGGNGGGGSIAIYVTGSGPLVLKSGSLVSASFGATGGNGLTGTGGGNGSAGSNGNAAFAMSNACNPNCQPNGFCDAAGGTGGAAGGNGGGGGQGGGGAGGASLAIVVQKTVTLDIRDGSVPVWSNVAADGGQPNGQPGDQGKVRTF